MNLRHQFLASVPRGFADLLQGELAGFGALDLRERGNAVSFTGSLEVAYRACLESRVASRVFLELGGIEADTDAAIYAALRALDWNAHVDPRGTLACEWSGRHPAIANTHFGTLRLKDAICDTLRDATGLRPSIATEAPSATASRSPGWKDSPSGTRGTSSPLPSAVPGKGSCMWISPMSLSSASGGRSSSDFRPK